MLLELLTIFEMYYHSLFFFLKLELNRLQRGLHRVDEF